MFKKYIFVILAFILGLVYLILEVFIHVYIFKIATDYWMQLFFPSPHEAWMRLILIIILSFFGVLGQVIINSRRKAINDLQAAKMKAQELLDQSVLYRNLLIHDITNIFQNIKMGQNAWIINRG